MQQKVLLMSKSDPLYSNLVCPASHQSVRLAPKKIVTQLNKKVKAGEAVDVSGAPVTDTVEALLLRSDKSVAYLIKDGVPQMLAERGIPITSAQ